MDVEAADNLFSNRDELVRLDFGSLLEALSTLKSAAVSRGDESTATYIWTREEVAKVHRHYQEAFGQFRDGQFYDGWCLLERCEIKLKMLRRHLDEITWKKLLLAFLACQIEHWQSLFPYRIFASPEFIHHEARCSICDSVIGVRTSCGHRRGRVYQGKLCTRVITKPELIGISIVPNPVQKYSVVGVSRDPVTGKTIDEHDYTSVRYVTERVSSPYHGWQPRFTKIRHPHTLYRGIGRNAPCPCDSRQKYKHCCLKTPGVLAPHIQIVFEVLPPPELLTGAYSRDSPRFPTRRPG